MDDLGPVLGVVTIAWAIAWVLQSIARSVRTLKLARLQAQLQGEVLGRLDSSEALLAYLQSDAGQRFAGSTLAEAPRTPSPHVRILRAIQVGLVVFAAGLGCWSLDSRLPLDDEHGFLVLGTVGMAVGIGFLVSGVASWWLSRSWGLLEGSPGRPAPPHESLHGEA